ncbi:MAG: Nitrogen regulatory protein P-II [Methanothrix sp.]|jgi:nitrogen regulatory protein PII|nr:MAG: Nitrogen regulatory protein P-II [Methanothrix sp.]
MKCETDMSLIVTIVKKGWGDEVLCASKDAGAEGGTILFGRGVGVHEQKKLLNIMIEPEKEVVFTVVSSSEADGVIEAVVEAGKLNEPGRGIAFILPIERLLGRVHKTAAEKEAGEEEGEEDAPPASGTGEEENPVVIS